MLVNLTPLKEEINRRALVAQKHGFEYTPQSDPKFLVETGIYISSCPFNFPVDEFKELSRYSSAYLYLVFPDYRKVVYGVADNVEQIKDYYKEEIEDQENRYAISISFVDQNKENKGKGGGWRWHKWGMYIGDLDPQHEYLDDEDFGEDFKHVIVFQIYKVK